MNFPIDSSAANSSFRFETTTPAVPSSSQTNDKPGDICKSLKVLHVINGEFFAGAERVQMHLGRCLPSSEVYADFVCLKDGEFRKQFDLTDSNLYSVPMRGRWDLRVVSQVSKLASENRYDLIHAHTVRSAMIASQVSKDTGIPWVYHVHSPVARDSSHRVRNWINQRIERRALRNVLHLFTVSESLRKQLMEEGWSEDRVTTIHNGVPKTQHRRVSLPPPDKRWTFGMVALIRPRKGLEVALESLRILQDQDYSVSLRCIGPFETAQYESVIRRRIDRMGLTDSVHFTGFTKDITSALTQIDAMLLPSLYGEGLPMVVLEAMASGLPIVATRVEGTPEAIRHGEDGLLAKPQCASSLAEQMANLINEPQGWARMALSAIQRHNDFFSDHAMASATASAYRRVLGLGSNE